MTDPDLSANSSEDDSLPPAWLIATGIVVVLTLTFVVGFGFGQQWGAPQWGPLAGWFAGAATFAAVVVALRQSHRARLESMRGHLARLVDHEVSRRRECIKALGDLWGAITGLQMEFTSWTNDLKTQPPGQAPERIRQFSWKWQNTIEHPLFVALLVLRGTALYEAVREVNENIDKIKLDGLDGIWDALEEGQRPKTEEITAMWKNVIDRREEHLRLARQHFSLERPGVERYVRRNSTL